MSISYYLRDLEGKVALPTEEAYRPAVLELKDGTKFSGYSFGHDEGTAGEVVFNTGMVGYPESLTDPSYCGQLLCITYPLVGNYGVSDLKIDDNGLPINQESFIVHVKALIVADYSAVGSHHSMNKSLGDWLRSQKVTAIGGIDTRALTKHIRAQGCMLARIVVGTDEAPQWFDPGLVNLVAKVSNRETRVFGTRQLKEEVQQVGSRLRPIEWPSHLKLPSKGGKVQIIVVDCGIKGSMIGQFLNARLPNGYSLSLKVVPWDFPLSEEDPSTYDGIFISNGPGDPAHCLSTVNQLRLLLNDENKRNKPIFGVCMGHQLLALAAGAKTYKMKFGNRGMNQPVIDKQSGRCFITPQNHGYAVDTSSLPEGWVERFYNANDSSNEGIAHVKYPWSSVQFHPEASGGPTDTLFLFHDFIHKVITYKDAPPSKDVVEKRQPFVSKAPVSVPIEGIRKVLLLGSGGLSIGQAGEFDYSGSQAIKALKELGIEVIVVNPNIATVQTSEGLADRVYFLPIEPAFVTDVIKKERPDGVLCSFGGQTALNCAVKMFDSGVFEEFNVRVLGSPIEAVKATEDRDQFAVKLREINEPLAPSQAATSVEEAIDAAERIGYPVLIRSAYALGGLGSGFARNREEVVEVCEEALKHSSQLFVDKSLTGWKEIEYEVLRDCYDNCVAVCNMENFDPLGVHTGDSVVVAPSQTLTDHEYYLLRERALKVIRHLGIVGECNIQFAVSPHKSFYYIVEVNARLSRSSALASKATGYPLAYVAAKVALGYNLVELRNAVTGKTTACFEPALDFVVTKVPRWDLDKFQFVDSSVGSVMKSVGEVMAIGRTFEESLQKALRMVNENCSGFDPSYYVHKYEALLNTSSEQELLERVCADISRPSPYRIWAMARAFTLGLSVNRVCELTKIDKWFVAKLFQLHSFRQVLQQVYLEDLTPGALRNIKIFGFSDTQIAEMLKTPVSSEKVLQHRLKLGVRPWVKRIDTLAAEFAAITNYLYLTYHGREHDVDPLLPPSDPRTVRQDEPVPPQSNIIVLGCGCYRVGSSVEFDWSAMSCVRALRRYGHRVTLVNCNPETVSTDYDESDRLYFDSLDLETVLSVYDYEKPAGVVVSVGGQTANNLALPLGQHGVHILGTAVESIDRAEDRDQFSKLCDELFISQPPWCAFSDMKQALAFATQVGLPVVVRPSYVLSGTAMRVVSSTHELERFLMEAKAAARHVHQGVVVSKFIEGAKEIEFDGVAAAGEILNYAISEHVENAGVHSGDATLLLPAQKLYVETIRRIKHIAKRIARGLKISGPFNVQFLSVKNRVQVIECNLRVSRSFPFVSKTFGIDFVDQATRVMLGERNVRPEYIKLDDFEYVGVKAPVFSFSRLKGADPRLGVEMRSTGEIACFGSDKHEAYLKALVASGVRIPKQGGTILLSLGPEHAKIGFGDYARRLLELGYQIYATTGTYDYLRNFGLVDAMGSALAVEVPTIIIEGLDRKDGEALGNDCDATLAWERSISDDVSSKESETLASSSQCAATPHTTTAGGASKVGSPTSSERGLMREVSLTEAALIAKADDSLESRKAKKAEKAKGEGGGEVAVPVQADEKISSKKEKKAETRDRKGTSDERLTSAGVRKATELILKGEVDLVINVPNKRESISSGPGYTMRRLAVNCGVPLILDLKAAQLLVDALEIRKTTEGAGAAFWDTRAWDEYTQTIQMH